MLIRATIIFILILLLPVYPQDVLKIMPLGDSITRGATGEPDDSGNAGYRKALYDSLRSLGYRSSLEEGTDFDFVGSQTTTYSGSYIFDKDHEGRSGWSISCDTSGSILHNIKDFLSLNTPDVILLHIGTNDISSNDNIETMVSELNSLIDSIHDFNQDIHIILSKLVYRIYPDSLIDSTKKFNSFVENMAINRITNNSKLHLVNAGEDFIYIIDKTPPYTGDMWDNLHPNYSGYRKMAKVWFNKLKELLTPALAFPEDNNQNISEAVTLSWFPALGANSYKIEIAEDVNFNNLFNEYSITDTFLFVPGLEPNTTYYWRVSAKINTGYSPFSNIRSFKTFDPVLVMEDNVPGSNYLYQNYPNPFNPSTTIRFAVKKGGYTKVNLYDILGNKIDVLFDEYVEENRVREINFEADRHLASGSYFYEIIINGEENFREVKKMTLIR